MPNLKLPSGLGGQCSFLASNQSLYDVSGTLTALGLLVMTAILVSCTAATVCLRISLLLSQALLRARTRKRRTTNYFTCQFRANYSCMSGGLAHAILNPCTYLSALAHVLLLACILCPASRLLHVDNGNCTDYCAWRRLYLLHWISLSHRPIVSK